MGTLPGIPDVDDFDAALIETEVREMVGACDVCGGPIRRGTDRVHEPATDIMWHVACAPPATGRRNRRFIAGTYWEKR